MRKRCDIPHSASHFQKSLIIASWLLAFLFTGTAFAQESRTIKGIVRDVTGEPLIGASVIQKGTNNGVITDVDGNFTLTVPADATLSIAYMGYATREINLAKRKKQGDLKITLSEDTQQLKEVVVTAMGIKKDTKRVGYAISTISADELVKAGAPNFASAMYGKAPGVRITQTQGGSAGAVSINVRGLTSITGNNQPLIILDGVPIRNGGTGKGTEEMTYPSSRRDSMAFHTAARLTPRARLISSPDRGFPSRAFNSASTSSRSIRSTSFHPLLYPSPPKSSTYISF